MGVAFVPTPRDSVTATSLGRDMVLVDSQSGMVHALNAVAAIVWQCFDGHATLEEIVVDLADGFSMPVNAVREDVLNMTRAAAHAGLLVGIDLLSPAGEGPAGLPEGQLVRLPRRLCADRTDQLRGTLLVQWSPTCGFCERILPELVAVQPALRNAGLAIVFVDLSDAQATRAQLSDAELKAEVVSGQEAISLADSVFPGMGTPVAYLLDPASRIASQVAYGAPNVVELARRSAGADQEPEDAGARRVPKFLPVAGGVCGPGASSGPSFASRAVRAYEIGDYRVGIRANSESTESIVGEYLAAHQLPEDVRAPENFYVSLHHGADQRVRSLNTLVTGSATVARSRSPRQVMVALVQHLSCLLDPEPGLFRIDAMGATLDGKGVLLPKAVRFWLDRMQAPLARLGFGLAQQPFAHVDPISRELVVNPSRVHVNDAALRRVAGSPPAPSEPPPVVAGRYSLASWLIPVHHGFIGAVSPAEAVAGALGTLVLDPAELPRAVEPMADLIEHLEVIAVPCDNAAAFREVIGKWVGRTL